MLTLSQLQAKRATLQSQLEQLVGQINRVNGAVAVLDELIGEEEERQEAEDPWNDPIWKAVPAPTGIDRTPSPYWNNYANSEPAAPVSPVDAPVLSAQQIVNDALAKVAAIQAAPSEPSYSLDGIAPPAPTQLEPRP